MLNMDETSWKLLNHCFLTIAERGAEGISCLFEGDPKACITAIATRDAAGGKLPLWTIAKGKMERSEAKVRQECSRDTDNGGLIVTHQPSGWTSRDVAMQYLHWFADTYREHIVLVWDLDSADRDPQVRELARELHIQLVFIPPGATDECQPLDRRIFGNLKQRARRQFDNEILQARFRQVRVGQAVRILLDVWKSITQDEILAAWEHLRPDDTRLESTWDLGKKGLNLASTPFAPGNSENRTNCQKRGGDRTVFAITRDGRSSGWCPHFGPCGSRCRFRYLCCGRCCCCAVCFLVGFWSLSSVCLLLRSVSCFLFSVSVLCFLFFVFVLSARFFSLFYFLFVFFWFFFLSLFFSESPCFLFFFLLGFVFFSSVCLFFFFLSFVLVFLLFFRFVLSSFFLFFLFSSFCFFLVFVFLLFWLFVFFIVVVFPGGCRSMVPRNSDTRYHSGRTDGTLSSLGNRRTELLRGNPCLVREMPYIVTSLLSHVS
jgi:hypothetical protein